MSILNSKYVQEHAQVLEDLLGIEPAYFSSY